MAVNPLAIGGGVVAAAAVVGGGLYAGGVFSSSTDQTGSRTGGGTPTSKKIDWRPLYEDAGYWDTTNTSDVNTTYKTKWGEKYAGYLLGSGTAKAGAKIADNTTWWTKKFNEWSTKTPRPTKGKFKDIDKGKGEDTDAKALSKVCNDAYKAATSDVLSSDTDDNKFFEEQVWKYCSPLGKKPTFVNANTTEKAKYGADKIGSESTIESKLVSIDNEENDLFWQVRQEEFFAASGTFSGSGGEQGKFFKRFYEQHKNSANKPTIKSKCQEAYMSPKTVASGSANPDKDQTLKFCSLEGK